MLTYAIIIGVIWGVLSALNQASHNRRYARRVYHHHVYHAAERSSDACELEA
jgi:hypothetical protein